MKRGRQQSEHAIQKRALGWTEQGVGFSLIGDAIVQAIFDKPQAAGADKLWQRWLIVTGEQRTQRHQILTRQRDQRRRTSEQVVGDHGPEHVVPGCLAGVGHGAVKRGAQRLVS